MWRDHRDEITADFQEYYGMDLWAVGLDGYEDTTDIHRVASLLSQLPSTSRIAVLENPDLAWNTEAHLLRQLEYDIRTISYQLSNGKGKKPELIELPSERVKHDQAMRSAEKAQAEVFERLKDIFPKSN